MTEAGVMAFAFPSRQVCHDDAGNEVEALWHGGDAPLLIYEGHQDHVSHSHRKMLSV